MKCYIVVIILVALLIGCAAPEYKKPVTPEQRAWAITEIRNMILKRENYRRSVFMDGMPDDQEGD